MIRKKFLVKRGKKPAAGKKNFRFANQFMKNAKSFG